MGDETGMEKLLQTQKGMLVKGGGGGVFWGGGGGEGAF